MELVDGLKVTDLGALRAAGIDPAQVVQDLMRIYTRMILAAGFFQADPHPGNLFVRPGGQIVLMDFGLAKELPRGFGLGLFELGFRTKTGDASTFVEIARRMMRRSETGRFEGEFTEEMKDELFEAIRENPVVSVPAASFVGRVFSFLSGIAHTLGHRANVLGDGGEHVADWRGSRPVGPAARGSNGPWCHFRGAVAVRRAGARRRLRSLLVPPTAPEPRSRCRTIHGHVPYVSPGARRVVGKWGWFGESGKCWVSRQRPWWRR
jgi:predicted unusual protein kinase regulating ubiquinone biosynthesis (AarF/ABC1/UbiB family)